MSKHIGITGSWKQKDAELWELTDFEGFKNACIQLGKLLAQSKVHITVGSDSEDTADKYVVEGYLSNYSSDLSIRVIRPKKKGKPPPFAKEHGQYGNAFVYLPELSKTWRHTRQSFISDIDSLILIGGADGTYQAGLELLLTRKRLVPIASFGGAASRLHSELYSSGIKRNKELFEKLNNPWNSQLATLVIEILRANRPPKILIIYGHAEDRLQLKTWLEENGLAEPVLMGQELNSGETIPGTFEKLADEADAAIALATPDDLAWAVSNEDVKEKRARQNVLVEIGWFWGRLGLDRVLLLVRSDIEMPSDLRGLVQVPFTNSFIEKEDEIQKFLKQISGKN